MDDEHAVSMPVFKASFDERGRVARFWVLSPWPERILIADSLLEDHGPDCECHFLTRGDGIVTFRCHNGEASYALAGRHPDYHAYIGVLSPASDYCPCPHGCPTPLRAEVIASTNARGEVDVRIGEVTHSW